jgi:HAD superfamily hydrolase (TIGR01509 family)
LCEVHLSKPGKDIFLLALKNCGLKAEECIFIDDKEKNVAAAKALGFNAVLFRDNKQLFADLKKAGV